MEMVLEVRPDLEPYDSTFFTTSNPAVTLPNTTCLPSSLNAQRAELFLPPDIQNNSSEHPDDYSLAAGLILVVFFFFLCNRPKEVHHFYQEFCSQLSADYTPPAAFPHTAAWLSSCGNMRGQKKKNAKTKGFPEGGSDYGKELFAVVQKEWPGPDSSGLNRISLLARWHLASVAAGKKDTSGIQSRNKLLGSHAQSLA